YVVSANQAFYIGMDPLSAGNGLYSGQALKQTGVPIATNTFNGTAIVSIQSAGTNTGTTHVQAGILTANGSGTFNASLDDNDGGTISTQTIPSGSYSVAANGRTTITAGSHPPILYAVTANEAFFIGGSNAVEFGFVDPQVGSSYSN